MKKKKIFSALALLLVNISLQAKVSLYQTFQEMNASIPGMESIEKMIGAGDINGDGFDDIVIVTDEYFYFFWGARHMDLNPDLSMYRIRKVVYYFDELEFSPVGDINGDGFDDFFIGYFGSFYIDPRIGFEYYNYSLRLYQGSENPDLIHEDEITRCSETWYNCYYNNSNYRFDRTVVALGDRNGDGNDEYAYHYYNDHYNGYADIITYNSAKCHITDGFDLNGDGRSDLLKWDTYPFESSLNVYLGYPSGAYESDYTLLFDEFNLSSSSNKNDIIHTMGDINGDGFDDFCIGPNKASSHDDSLYFYWGAIPSRLRLSKRFGFSSINDVKKLYDVNGDGYDDFCFTTNDKQELYLFYGGPSAGDFDYDVLSYLSTNTYIESYQSAGDINNDGYADLLVSTQEEGSADKAYVYYGGAGFSGSPDITFDYEGADNSFGWALSSAGDMNGDGFDDIISGAFGYYQNTGRAYIYLGNSPMDQTADLVLTGGSVGDYFGVDAAGLGDINRDGYDDVIVGAEGVNNHTGNAYVYFGDDTLSSAAALVLSGENENDYFGKSVSSAGDVNGDGYPDIIVAAKEYANKTGRVYIFYGGAEPDAVPDIVFDGEVINIEFGIDVAAAGDINHDGYDDIIIGADNAEGYTGRAYIYFGGSAMDSEPDLVLDGEDSGDLFGFCVTGAGDLNLDGYDDFAVGAYKHNSDRGRVYVYYGGANPDNTADLVIDGLHAYDNFGRTLAGVGDVNQDGFSDLFVGAYVYNHFTGQAYVYHGAPTMDAVADDILTGEATYAYFGSAVSGAGDVNDDGTNDLIVGAYKYGDGNNGKLYLYQYEPVEESVNYTFTDIGWQLISLPVIIKNNRVSDLFPAAHNGQAFLWNGYEYLTVDTLEPRQGYWIYIDTPGIVTIAGAPIYHYRKEFSSTGWYLLGSVMDGASLTDPSDSPDNTVLTPAFSWDAAAQCYTICDRMDQIQCCWIAVMETCELDVNSTALQGLSKKNMEMALQGLSSPPPPPSNELANIGNGDDNLPQTYCLYANYPNPFNPTTTVRFDCPKTQRVHITVYNTLGQQVRTLTDQTMDAGAHQIIWDAKDESGNQLPSNIYFIRMQSGKYIKAIKCVLMK